MAEAPTRAGDARAAYRGGSRRRRPHPDAPDWTAEAALELVGRAAHGRPVAHVDCGIPPDPSGWSYAHGFPDEWVRTQIGPLT